MKINNILFVSPLNQEIQNLIENYELEKKFRYLTEDELRDEDLEWADAFVSFKTRSSYDYSKVKWVHSLGAGVDSFIFKKDWNEDVILTRTICSFGQRISEYCLSYLLKDLQFHDQFLYLKSTKNWEPLTPNMLNEVKVMIYGTGEIGQKIAQVLSFFGVEVYGVSRSGKQKEFFKEVCTVDAHFSLLNQMNYLINTLPLTEETEYLFNKDIYKHVSNIGFVNVGRGESIRESDLLQALEFGQVRFAVLDVFGEEPLPQGNVLWEHPNVVITPHISAVTTSSEAVECFVGTLENLEKDNPLHNRVDVKKGF
ncbi:D-2-hydroxyacid dehydrogenase [Gracilibacillus salitolerans]|uniref:D-2-hydroxyacid dehydrogenase n=1 Tax=Gracilibacillus salitolerans TaxID=2663022 RepID=A0A5Q2TFX0_9BACI|nr:D-2-hydroxyacid dehydrogenase [Gracilibacillus salitolerans]QGH33704.1 D-2-hydroxyacid dehydrogenase [Gracilibacillus salitolerans]